MSKIKLRVWDKVMNKMYKPQAISFDTQSSVPFAVSVPRKSWERVEKFELLQWTGLVDQTGVDVYEADLVQIASIIYKVIWNESIAAFELADLCSTKTVNVTLVSSGDVIGNEFENPNLLGGNYVHFR